MAHVCKLTEKPTSHGNLGLTDHLHIHDGIYLIWTVLYWV